MTSVKSLLLVLLVCFLAQGSYRGAFAREGAIVEDLAERVRAHGVALPNENLRLTEEALREIGDLIGEARIVALGEATHGTVEESYLRRQIVEYLVREKGFSLFGIEDQVAEAGRVDSILSDPTTDAARALKELRFWPWQNEEMGHLVAWMQAQKLERGTDSISFHGFDMQFPFLAVENLAGLLETCRPELISLYENAVDALGGEPEPYGLAKISLPAKELRGQKVKISGAIRTVDVREGWANFGAGVRRSAAERFFAHASPEEPVNGSSDWSERTFYFKVPGEADHLEVVFVLQGRGAAFFDDITIETVAGEPLIEIDFAGDHHPSVSSETSDIEISLAPDDERGGRVLRVSSKSHHPNPNLDSRALWTELLSQLEGTGAHHGEDPCLQCQQSNRLATVALQYVQAQANETYRDAAMAANVALLLHHNSDKKAILWGHNAHFAKESHLPGGPGNLPMGAYLKETFGDDYVVLGLAVGDGTYRAFNREEHALAENVLPPALNGSIEEILQVLDPDLTLVWLSELTRSDKETVFWHRLPGSTATDDQFYRRKVFADYDALIWIPDVTASQLIDFRSSE